MEIKTVNRKIPEYRENINERFRVQYKDKHSFDLLVVNICRLKTNETQTFKFRSKELPNKESIYFSTSIEKGKLKVSWKGISTKQNNKKTGSSKKTGDTKESKIITEKEFVQSFSPIIGELPNILILGTIPGKDSLRLQEYYANYRNSFWKIIYSLFNSESEMDYEKKTEFIKKNMISIWDVCHKAIRESSLDSDIENEIPNNIKDFIDSHPTIKMIAFNGQKAEKLYFKYFDKFENIEYLTLLSTSPANASYTFENKLNDWKRIIKPSL